MRDAPISRYIVSRMWARTRVASRESPPNAKKLSWMPTRSIWRISAQRSVSTFSSGVRGATKVCGVATPLASQLRRQADTLHFARWALSKLRENDDLARDLEVGDAADDELTYVCRRRRSVGPQH